MFLGEFEHSLDEKNRVVLPSGLRKDLSEQKLAEGFVLALGTKNQWLDLHPKSEWIDHVRTLESRYSPEHEEAQEFLRDLLSSAIEVQLDKQSRILIPEARREEVGIDRAVFFVGVSKKIEIWPRERWLSRKTARKGKLKAPVPMGTPPAPGT